DVPTVAGRDQGQQADRAVFRTVDPAGELTGRHTRAIDQPSGQRPPDGPRLQAGRRQRERLLADDLVRRNQLPDEPDDLVGHIDVSEAQIGVPQGSMVNLIDYQDV